jgi:hypothetical protein
MTEQEKHEWAMFNVHNHPKVKHVPTTVEFILLLLILLLIAGRVAHCQTVSPPFIITITDNTTTEKATLPFKMTFSGCTVGGTPRAVTLTCSGTGGGVTSFFGNTGNITALVDPTTIVDASGSFIAFKAGSGTVADLTLQDPSGNVIYLKSLPGFGNPAGISINASGSGGGDCFFNDAVVCADSDGDTLNLSGSQTLLGDNSGDNVVTVSGAVDLSDNNGDDCQLQTGTWTCGGSSGNPIVAIDNGIQHYPTTYANLPGCSSSTEGSLYAITDDSAVTAVWGATVTAGGGSTHVLAYCDGTNWTVAAK